VDFGAPAHQKCEELVAELEAALDCERRRADELATHDNLTGLPNRSLLEEHLRMALARARRTDHAVILLHVDLDAFKLVNESLGHAGGDRLLEDLAVRLAEDTRATDILSRPGGDELLLLVADVDEDPVLVAERAATGIITALDRPFVIDGREFQVSASVGVSIYPRDARDGDELLNHADSAMYRAKAVARGGFAIYESTTGDPLEKLALHTRIRRAMADGEFLLHYQPIFDLPAGRIIGVEALMRWHDPERGMVPPNEFIPLAEETGLIEELGDWVVGAVCEQQVKWARRGFSPHISFNVSPRQLRRLDFAERVAFHLTETGADPAHLVVELTESSTMEDPATSEPILHELHRLGFKLALDDFGSGYSSLARLRELPVQTLKIDRAFMQEVPQNREASAIVTAILDLSRALGRATVAEGVETEEQRVFLIQQGCLMAQGFLLGRPLPPEAVEALAAAA
jgi:diguanylate cyclase (GGDEF)-like protein